MARGKTDTKPYSGWGFGWGTYDSTGELPNTSGAALQDPHLNVGDVACVGTELYVCTAAGQSAATWALLQRASSTTALTATRVPYVTTGGVLKDEAGFTYTEGSDTLAAVNVTASGTVTATTTLTASGAATVGTTLGVTGATTLSSTLAVTGASTLTGGVVATTTTRIGNIPIGGVARASIGTDGTSTAGTVYFAEFWLPANKTLTGLAPLNGTTSVGTDKVIVALYNSAGTSLLANSALAGTLASGADAFQEIAFTGTYAAVGPARYWVAMQVEGTTTPHQRISADTYLNSTGSVAGSFGTLPSTITPTTTTTADVGPIMYAY